MKVEESSAGITIKGLVSRRNLAIPRPFTFVFLDDLIYVLHSDKNESVVYVYDTKGITIDMRRYDFPMEKVTEEDGKPVVFYTKGNSRFKSTLSNASFLQTEYV